MLYLAFVLLLSSQGSATEAPRPTPTPADLNAASARLSETDPEEALSTAKLALAGARERGEATEEASALHNIAAAYRALGVPDLAAESARLSAERAAAARDGRGEARAHNILGLIAADSGRFGDALEHHLRALAIRERIGDRAGISYSLNNLGNIYRNTQQYDKALEYHGRALAIKIELGDKRSEAYSHHNIGLVYRAMDDPPRALAAFERGLALRDAIGDRWGMASSLNAIAQVQALTSPRDALATYTRALELRRTVGDRRGEAGTYNNIGALRLRMGDPSGALAVLERALALSIDAGAPLVRVEALQFMSEAEAARGRHAAALDRYREHVALKDSLFNQQNSDRINRLQAAHEAQRREQQIALLEREKALVAAALERTTVIRTGLLAVVMLGGLCLALLYARYRVKHRSEAQLQAQAAQLREALASVKTLRGLIPICSHCKKIRDDRQSWHQLERYIQDHSDAAFSHGICPECLDEWSQDIGGDTGLAVAGRGSNRGIPNR
jgi:tetratricopeptide (TPR) repeat protein